MILKRNKPEIISEFHFEAYSITIYDGCLKSRERLFLETFLFKITKQDLFYNIIDTLAKLLTSSFSVCCHFHNGFRAKNPFIWGIDGNHSGPSPGCKADVRKLPP